MILTSGITQIYLLPARFEALDVKRRLWCAFDAYRITDDQRVGDVVLEHADFRHCTTHTRIIKYYRNQGFGREMYYLAINYALGEGWKISSTVAPSHDAIRCWQSKWLNKLIAIEQSVPYPFRATTINKS